MGTALSWKEKLFCVVAYVPKATVQAAIGAVPLAAGVASGETILAVAVLSILLTAPIGAIAIKVLGERILDREESSTYRFKDLREKMVLPRVGERVVSRRHGTVWKVIEERETWIEDPVRTRDGKTTSQLTPAILLRYWKEESSRGPGTGKTLQYRYSRKDPTFAEHWEVLYDW
jgi:hypothetical protein